MVAHDPLENLTDVWQGEFSYPGPLRPTSFTATLFQVGDKLYGGTHEICLFGDLAGELLIATLSGAVAGSVVTFQKTYDPPRGGYRTVSYSGLLNADATLIEGEWRITRLIGRFIMIRSRRQNKYESIEMLEVAGA